MFKRLLFASSLFAAMSQMARADSILYFVDQTTDIDRMALALVARTPADTVVIANSSSEFATEISTGNFNLGILFIQRENAPVFQDAIFALSNFVDNGGKAIYTDWSANNSYASLFGFTFAAGTNETSMTVGPQLSTGLSTNPMQIDQGLWTDTFSTALNAPDVQATFEDSSAAIVRTRGGSVFVNGFLSDTPHSLEDGIQLYTNEINTLLAPPVEPTSTPLPATCLAGFALLGATGIQRSRSRPQQTVARP
jgi:hypothetical protein